MNNILKASSVAVLLEMMEDGIEDLETDKDEDGGGGGEDVHATSAGQTDGGGHPETGGGGETTDHVLTLMEDDGACTDETNARYNLCGNARDIPAVFG